MQSRKGTASGAQATVRGQWQQRWGAENTRLGKYNSPTGAQWRFSNKKGFKPRHPLSHFQMRFYVETQYVEGIRVESFGVKQEWGRTRLLSPHS